ncbi:MAG TPA: ABC transporter ATP-binding protein, partial [Herpetosiphonaceae bacterium]
RADLMRHCLKLDPAFHHEHTPGALIERVDGDVATLSNFFGRFVINILGNVLLLAGVIALLFRIDWRVGAALLGWAACTALLLRRLSTVGVPHWTASRAASADLFGFLEERLSGTEDIRANGAGAYVMSRLHGRARSVIRLNRRAILMGSATGNAMILMFGVATALGLGMGVWLFQRGEATLGTVYLIFSYTQLMSKPIEQITRQIQDLQQATASIGRIYELFGHRSAIGAGGRAELPAGPLAVEFRDVAFGYAAESPVLDGVSFAVPAGASVGILGRTGSGKSTVARLLSRLYDPDGGAVLLGGADARELTLAGLRGRIGMVTQDIHLFHASLRDNLTLFDRSVPDARLAAALERLGLGPWLAALPDGLDTLLSAEGTGLSAGESQLLAFARVFLSDPGVVILDEASSRLDPATEALVEQAVDQLLANRTGLIIAHRLATVQRVDYVLVLDRGRVAEFGPRAALAADPGSHFHRLLQVGLEDAFA